MAALLQVGLVNAALATLLACGVALIARKVRQPALIHFLWIIVLIKLVTPPILEVPIEVPFPLLTAAGAVSDSSSGEFRQPQSVRPDDSSPALASGENLAAAVSEGSARQEATGERLIAAEQPGPLAALFSRLTGAASAALAIWSAWLLRNIVAVLGWTWLGGALLWFLRQALTTLRYSRRLALATPAPAALQQQADDLSRAMGLSYRPPVLIVRDVISPMLWGIGRNTRLLFPVDLLARLEAGARETLIAHELAHFRRRDHWVRAFELVVSGLFWWHPVVWWARREIEIAEEECCDAWVIEQFPRAPRCYAEALLTTLDFLSGESTILPPAAAGMGQVPFLKRRLTAIMRGVAPKAMSGPAWLAALTAATALLPWHPGLTPTVARSTAAAALAPVAEIASGDVSPIAADAEQLSAEPSGPSEPVTVEIENAAKRAPAPVEELPWAVAKSPDGRYLLARLGRENSVFLQEVSSGKRTDLSEYHIVTVAFAPDGQVFATGGSDRTVRVWACSTGEVLQTFRGHGGPVQSVVFAQGGKSLISAGDDGTFKHWHLELGGEMETFKSRFGPVNGLAVSPDGRWLALGIGSWQNPDRGGHVKVLALPSFKEQDVFQCELGIGAVAFKPDGNTLLAGDWKGRVYFRDVAEKQFLGTTLPRYKDKIAEVQFSADTQALGHVEIENVFEQGPFELPFPATLRIFFDQSASIAPVSGASPDAAVVIPNGFGASRFDRPAAIRQNGVQAGGKVTRALEPLRDHPAETRATRPGNARQPARALPRPPASRLPPPTPSEPGD
ncbi:MAG: M56 family metallopeptidase [Deltaproteobacteria bacterium]